MKRIPHKRADRKCQPLNFYRCKVCKLPPATKFCVHGCEETDYVVLTVDEYECIRLVNHQGFSQEQCAKYMQVSRATAQLVCDSARKKIATALVNGRGIHINGRDFRLCEGDEEHCGCGGCKKHCQLKK